MSHSGLGGFWPTQDRKVELKIVKLQFFKTQIESWSNGAQWRFTPDFRMDMWKHSSQLKWEIKDRSGGLKLKKFKTPSFVSHISLFRSDWSDLCAHCETDYVVPQCAQKHTLSSDYVVVNLWPLLSDQIVLCPHCVSGDSHPDSFYCQVCSQNKNIAVWTEAILQSWWWVLHYCGSSKVTKYAKRWY